MALLLCLCVCACVRACVRACVCVCVCVCVEVAQLLNVSVVIFLTKIHIISYHFVALYCTFNASLLIYTVQPSNWSLQG